MSVELINFQEMIQNEANVAFVVGQDIIGGIGTKVAIFFHASQEHHRQHCSVKHISSLTFSPMSNKIEVISVVIGQVLFFGLAIFI